MSKVKKKRRTIITNLKNRNKAKCRVIHNQCLFLSRKSKDIYNAGIFFHRQWYLLYKKQLRYIFNNIDNYIHHLSFRDLKEIIKFVIKDKDKLFKICDYLDNITIEIINKLFNSEYITEYIYVDNSKRIKYKNITIIKESRNQNYSELLEWINNDNIFNSLHEMQINYRIKLQTTLQQKIKNAGKRKKKFNSEEEKKQEMMNKQLNIIFPIYLGDNICDTFISLNDSNYILLPALCAQQVSKHVDDAYTSFFKKRKNGDYKAKPPNYLDKKGFYTVTWKGSSFKIIKRNKNNYDISLSLGNNSSKVIDAMLNEFKLSEKSKYQIGKITKKNFFIENKENPDFINIKNNKKINKTKMIFRISKKYVNEDVNKIKNVRLVPDYKGNFFNLELVIENNKFENIQYELDNTRIMAIDTGIINIVTITTNIKNEQPIIISGTEIKGINDKYNSIIKKKVSYDKRKYNTNTSYSTQILWNRRYNILQNIFHQLSAQIINYALSKKIHRIVIGYNTNWKNKMNLGRNNRMFHQIPFRKLIDYLVFKGNNVGIIVVEHEESYTSKCDALELETFDECEQRQTKRRIKRGLYKSLKGYLINADINGSLNIMRKYIYMYDMSLSVQINNNIKSGRSWLMNPKKIKLNLFNGKTRFPML